jgi:hypothetical protein
MCSSVRATTDGLVPLTRAPSYASTTWGPYYETLHPPCRVDFIVNWKVVPGLMDHAAGLWRRRQNLRRAYEAVHGCDPALWPTQHPGVVVEGHAACLGCHWMQERGYYRHDRVFQYPVDLARRHESSDGTFCGGDGKRPTARPLPSPLPVKTAAIPRRTAPIPPLRVAERYVAGTRHGRAKSG